MAKRTRITNSSCTSDRTFQTRQQQTPAWHAPGREDVVAALVAIAVLHLTPHVGRLQDLPDKIEVAPDPCRRRLVRSHSGTVPSSIAR